MIYKLKFITALVLIALGTASLFYGRSFRMPGLMFGAGICLLLFGGPTQAQKRGYNF